ncbi:MAG: beta-N-acetylglucosaminidase domain-containing protein [Prevotella sp.]|nr:beta-N-acetylglucosaminidase domain-containing protein [Prevotella sp.]
MRQKRLLTTLAVGFCALATVQAQDNGFDLTSQRSEAQLVNPVPGRKIDHQGLVINPTPRYMKLTGEGTVDITGGVRLSDMAMMRHFGYQEALAFLPQSAKGFPLRIEFAKIPVVDTSASVTSDGGHTPGAYSLKITKKGIMVQADDSDGAFYAIQTLRQLMESTAVEGGRKLPCLEIDDAPVFPYRGVVEGFYGTPWSHEVRLSLIDFYGKYKMNTYIYGPKDDPYHSSPNWRLPYPSKEQQNIRELVAACRRNHVDFVWAIHPGKDIKWNEEDYQNLLHKFNLMYADGVRSFAIFFDDISGEGTNPARQVELLNRLTHEFVETKEGVSPLIVCPTDYSKLWAKPGADGALSIYGKTLDPSVRVFWTGDVVCSDVTRETLGWVNSRIRRPAFFWWNYAVTDYVRNIILQGPVYGLEPTLTAKDMCGLVSNPMEHGEASKLSLYSVADYTWNPSAYNPIDSWERGLEVMMPHARDAYRTFAIHSADTETGYRRDESWETLTFRLADYTREKRDRLWQEFDKVAQAPAVIEAGCGNPQLLKELRPWLTEFGKLGNRGKKALELMDLYSSGGSEAFWTAYVKSRMSAADRQAYEAHKSGTMKLQPFYEWAMADLGEEFYARQAGERPFSLHAIGSYPNLKTTQSRLMLDADTVSFYTSGVSQQEGEWLGVDLGQATDVREVHILQGRNSKDDVDYYDHAALEYSPDGHSWQPLMADLRGQYDIHWAGVPVQARYVRLRRLDSERNNWVSVRSFKVNPVSAESLGFAVESTQRDAALQAFDRQPATSFMNTGTLSFGVPKGVTAYTLLLSVPEGSSVRLRQYGKRGKLKAEETVSADLWRTSVAKGVTRVELDGAAEVFEVIAR